MTKSHFMLIGLLLTASAGMGLFPAHALWTGLVLAAVAGIRKMHCRTLSVDHWAETCSHWS